MKIIIMISFIALAEHVSAAHSTWFVERMVQIEKAKSLPIVEQMETLGILLRIGGQTENPEAQEIYKTVHSMLISSPGHAKSCQIRIESLRKEVLDNYKKTNDEIVRLQASGVDIKNEGDYIKYIEFSLTNLRFLSSPETVEVLGNFLNDPEGKNGKTLLGRRRSNPGDDFPPSPMIAELAVSSIRALGIEHPPFVELRANPNGGIFDGEVDAWKDWWNEVKEGRRTYRFIGSSIEYGPDGLATREVIQRVERDRKRDNERALGKKRSLSSSKPTTGITQISQPTSIAWLIAVIGLCAVAVWYFLRSRKAVP